MQIFTDRVNERLSAKRAEIAARIGSSLGSIAESDDLPINIKKVLRDLAAEKKRCEKVLKTKAEVKVISVSPALEPDSPKAPRGRARAGDGAGDAAE